MRDPKRLDDFYDRLKKVHQDSFPDLRFGQFVMMVLGNIQFYKKDPFFVEEDEMIKYIESYSLKES